MGDSGEPAVSLPWFIPYLTAGTATQGGHTQLVILLSEGAPWMEIKVWEAR